MSSIEATYDVDGGGHKIGQGSHSSVLFPPSPPLLRPRADSHFGIRPALAALQNTFNARKRASSVSEDMVQKPRSPVFARLGLDPRPRTNSSLTVVPPSSKQYPSSLTFPIIESPDEAISRAPRIPSFHDIDASVFGHDLGLSLGLNPRISIASASTVRAQEGASMNKLIAQDDHSRIHHDELMHFPRDSEGAAQLTNLASGLPGLVPHALANPSGENSAGNLDTDAMLYAESHPDPLSHAQPAYSDSLSHGARSSSSHASQEKDWYFEGASSSPGAAAASTISPTHSTGFVSPPRSIAVVSPTRSILVPSPIASLPTSPVAMSTSLAPQSPSSGSSHPHIVAPIPFPLADDSGYTSDDPNATSSRYAYSRRVEDYSYSRSDAGGYDTPTLYTGTTNTSPTLSVTRVGPSEAPPALRLGPGIGLLGVGAHFAGGNAFNLGEGAGSVGGVVGSRSGFGMGLRPLTADSGVIVERDKDGSGDGGLADGTERNWESSGRSIHAESTSPSLHIEGSGHSFHTEAESSGRSVVAESSSGVGSSIRARVTSLRAPHALSVLIPAFMKRARRKSSRVGGDDDAAEMRGRAGDNAKMVEGWEAGDAKKKNRVESSRTRTEFSYSQSVTSSRPASDEEGDVSPTSSHLDLLSPDPFASTVALKVGAWSQMYANGTTSTVSAPLPPLPDLADEPMNTHSEYSGSVYDEDSEEESSIRIYSHGRGRSLSQPDVYKIPIEPLHQSKATMRRTGRSLDRRRGLGNWRRPALPARPSLPSLSMLTRKNVVVPIPRSAVAARFPVEPWDHAPNKDVPLCGVPTRGLGSLNIPPRSSHSPVRGIPFPRSPMRNLARLGSESSIAEDEDEGEDEDEDKDEDGGRVLSGGEDDKVWWSGPSSHAASSRRDSLSSTAGEPTVSMPIQTDPIVRESIASTIQPRDSIVSQVSQGLSPSARDSMISATSHDEIDVSSESFLQTLDELDPLTPPPSGRCSSEPSVEDGAASGPILNEVPTGVGPRNPGRSSSGTQGSWASRGSGQRQGSGRDQQRGSGGRGAGGGHGRGGGNNDRGNGGKDPRGQALSDSDESESSSESESDEPLAQRGRDTCGGSTTAARSQTLPLPPSSNPRTMHRQIAPPNDSSDESDDVPLAQRLPTALRAQKSIRIQNKVDSDARRQRRIERMKQRAAATGGEGGVEADELAKRLLSVQTGNDHRDQSPLPSPRLRLTPEPNSSAGGLFPGAPRSRTISNVSYTSRSKTHTRNGSMELAPPIPPSPGPTALSRSGTTSARRPSAPELPPPVPSKSSLSRSGTMSKSRASHENNRDQRPSLSRNGTASRHRGGSKTDDEGESSRFSRSRSVRSTPDPRPPMPPMPPMESYPISARRPSQPEPFIAQVVEQRVYIGDRQRFIVVDIGSPNITAKDILDTARQRGELDGAGSGGWQLWEMSNECGMERPVRDFELINDVIKAWNPEKRVNMFMIRRSQLCGILKSENIPSSSPLMSGWVMWVSRPGKWSKRWLELKEHGLFVCKNDKGKDQSFLCNLSHFDAYIVTHVPRAPKPYVFAAKSIDSSGVFEKEEDSSHIFSCDSEIGEIWLTKILLARSYILQQERVVSRPSNVGSSLSASKSLLSRSGTKKSTVSSRTAASGPLIQDLNPSPFAEGSLLAKVAANGI